MKYSQGCSEPLPQVLCGTLPRLAGMRNFKIECYEKDPWVKGRYRGAGDVLDGKSAGLAHREPWVPSPAQHRLATLVPAE